MIGRRLIEGFELGNEPELYANRYFCTLNGVDVFARPPSWDFESYLRDYTYIASAMGHVPIAGPAVGVYSWISDLLGQTASAGLADALEPYVAMAHADHLELRNAEMNSVSCGDHNSVAETFASALWVADTLFSLVKAGVDGVNIHTFDGANAELFSTTHTGPRWHAYVAPEYYGVWLYDHRLRCGAEHVVRPPRGEEDPERGEHAGERTGQPPPRRGAEPRTKPIRDEQAEQAGRARERHPQLRRSSEEAEQNREDDRQPSTTDRLPR